MLIRSQGLLEKKKNINGDDPTSTISDSTTI